MRWIVMVGLLLSPMPALAQAGDALTPPANLDAQGVPVPADGTAILGRSAPMGEIAIPVPPNTCAPLAAMVRANGYVLIPTGGGNAQRYVLDERYCDEGLVTKPAWVQTVDNPQCFIGYTCGLPNDE